MENSLQKISKLSLSFSDSSSDYHISAEEFPPLSPSQPLESISELISIITSTFKSCGITRTPPNLSIASLKKLIQFMSSSIQLSHKNNDKSSPTTVLLLENIDFHNNTVTNLIEKLGNHTNCSILFTPDEKQTLLAVILNLINASTNTKSVYKITELEKEIVKKAKTINNLRKRLKLAESELKHLKQKTHSSALISHLSQLHLSKITETESTHNESEEINI
jgi:hypothetical protein